MHSVKQCMFTVLREQKPDWKQLNYPISIELILHLFAVQDDGRVTINSFIRLKYYFPPKQNLHCRISYQEMGHCCGLNSTSQVQTKAFCCLLR